MKVIPNFTILFFSVFYLLPVDNCCAQEIKFIQQEVDSYYDPVDFIENLEHNDIATLSALIYSRVGKFEESREILNTIETKQIQDSYQKYQAAEAFYNCGYLNEAMQLIEEMPMVEINKDQYLKFLINGLTFSFAVLSKDDIKMETIIEEMVILLPGIPESSQKSKILYSLHGYVNTLEEDNILWKKLESLYKVMDTEPAQQKRTSIH